MSQDEFLDKHNKTAFVSTEGISLDKQLGAGDNQTLNLQYNPESLLKLAFKAVDQVSLQTLETWSNEDVCNWIVLYGYPEWKKIFRRDFINGRGLLVLDEAALSALGVRCETDRRDIAYGIKCLFFYELAHFIHKFSLHESIHKEIFKFFRPEIIGKTVRTPQNDLWWHLQLLRREHPRWTHHDLLEHWIDLKLDSILDIPGEVPNGKTSLNDMNSLTSLQECLSKSSQLSDDGSFIYVLKDYSSDGFEADIEDDCNATSAGLEHMKFSSNGSFINLHKCDASGQMRKRDALKHPKIIQNIQFPSQANCLVNYRSLLTLVPGGTSGELTTQMIQLDGNVGKHAYKQPPISPQPDRLIECYSPLESILPPSSMAEPIMSLTSSQVFWEDDDDDDEPTCTCDLEPLEVRQDRVISILKKSYKYGEGMGKQ